MPDLELTQCSSYKRTLHFTKMPWQKKAGKRWSDFHHYRLLDVQVLKEEIAWAAEVETSCTQFTVVSDSHLLTYKMKFRDRRFLAYIRELHGAVAPSSRVVNGFTKEKYDINFVIALQYCSFLCNVETNWLGRMIRETDIPVTR